MGKIGTKAPDPLTPAEQEWKTVLEDAIYIICGVAVMALILVSCLSRRVRKRGSREIRVPAIGPPQIKTWYGWADMDKDRRRAQKCKRCTDRICHLFWWRSTKIDYSWVFWDPSGEGQRQYEVERNEGILGRLPKWIRSYPYRYLQPDALAERGQMPSTRHLCKIPPTSPKSNTVNTDQLDGSFQADSSSNSLALISGAVQDEDLLDSGTIRRRNVGLGQNQAWSAYSHEIREAVRTQILISEEDQVAAGLTGALEGDTCSADAAPFQNPKVPQHYFIPKLRRVFSIPALYASYKDHSMKSHPTTSDVPLYSLQQNPLLASGTLRDTHHISPQDHIGYQDDDWSLHGTDSLARINNTDPDIGSPSKRSFSWDATRRSTLDIRRDAYYQIEDCRSLHSCLQDYEAEGSLDGTGSYRDTSRSSMASMYPDIGHHLNYLAAEVYRPIHDIVSVPPARSYTAEDGHVVHPTRFSTLNSLYTDPQALEQGICVPFKRTLPSAQQSRPFWLTRLIQRRRSSPNLKKGLSIFNEESSRMCLRNTKSMVRFSPAKPESSPVISQNQDLGPSFGGLIVRAESQTPTFGASQSTLVVPRKRPSQSKFQHNDIKSAFTHHSLDGSPLPAPIIHYTNPFAKPVTSVDRLSTVESSQASDVHRPISMDISKLLDLGISGPRTPASAKRSASVPSSSPPPGMTERQLGRKSQSIKREYTCASSVERYKRRTRRLSLGHTILAKDGEVETEEEGAGSDNDTIGGIEQVETGSEENGIQEIRKDTSRKNKDAADMNSGHEEMAGEKGEGV